MHHAGPGGGAAGPVVAERLTLYTTLLDCGQREVRGRRTGLLGRPPHGREPAGAIPPTRHVGLPAARRYAVNVAIGGFPTGA